MRYLKIGVNNFEYFISCLSHRVTIISALILITIMLLTVIDIFLRYLFNRPISGAFEITEILLAIFVSFSLNYTTIKKSNVTVGLLMNQISQKSQNIIEIITSIFGIAIFIFVIISVILFALDELKANVVSPVLRLPRFPFIFLASIGFVIVLLVLVFQLWYLFIFQLWYLFKSNRRR